MALAAPAVFVAVQREGCLLLWVRQPPEPQAVIPSQSRGSIIASQFRIAVRDRCTECLSFGETGVSGTPRWRAEVLEPHPGLCWPNLEYSVTEGKRLLLAPHSRMQLQGVVDGARRKGFPISFCYGVRSS